MVHEVVPAAEGALAVLAEEGLLALVDKVVGLKLVGVGETGLANLAPAEEVFLD